jgi:hypothetical protein
MVKMALSSGSHINKVGAKAVVGTLIPSIVDAKLSLSILHYTFKTFSYLIEVIKEWYSI